MPTTYTVETFTQAGERTSSAERTVPDEVQHRVTSDRRVRRLYAALRRWQQDAADVAAQTTNVTQAQQKELSRRFGQVCDGFADLLLHLGLDRDEGPQ
jgi:hypothetical protein